MKIGVFASFNTPATTPQLLQDIGRRVENAGMDSLWMGEHVVLFDEMEFGYPGSRDMLLDEIPRRTRHGGEGNPRDHERYEGSFE